MIQHSYIYFWPNNLEFQLDWVSIDLIFESLIGGKKDSAQPLYCFFFFFFFFFNIQTNYYHQNFGYFCNEALDLDIELTLLCIVPHMKL